MLSFYHDSCYHYHCAIADVVISVVVGGNSVRITVVIVVLVL